MLSLLVVGAWYAMTTAHDHGALDPKLGCPSSHLDKSAAGRSSSVPNMAGGSKVLVKREFFENIPIDILIKFLFLRRLRSFFVPNDPRVSKHNQQHTAYRSGFRRNGTLSLPQNLSLARSPSPNNTTSPCFGMLRANIL